jgi:cytochrome c-type biogenesis protein CcmH/NrfG
LTEQDNQFPAQTGAALEKCFAQIRLARATELARAKNFNEAENLMTPNGELPDDPRALDLLARIAAKQEEFSKARQLWETALQKSPGNQEFSVCLERVRKLERTSALLDTVVDYVVWPVVLLSIAAIVFAFKH